MPPAYYKEPSNQAGYAARAYDYLLETTDPHETRELPRDDVERGSCNEATNSWRRDELDKPTEMKQPNPKNNETADECDGGSDLWTVPCVRMSLVDVLDNLGDSERGRHPDAKGRV